MNILDKFAMYYGNVVLRDANGKPSIFVKHPKQNSIEFDASLPDHVHPAFVCGETTDSAVLIGKYSASEIEAQGTLYSLPNGGDTNIGGTAYRTYDNCLAGMKAFGNNVTGMTIADHGLMCLIQHANPDTIVRGDTALSVSPVDGTPMVKGQAYTVGTKKVYKGWEYTCQKAIGSFSATYSPDAAPSYWKRGAKIGGTTYQMGTGDDITSSFGTLSGSGPLSWYLNHDIAMEADLVGGYNENIYGVRLVKGEIQIIPNNLAADPESDLSASSTLWRAIKPTGSGAYEFVSPNTDEEHTCHYIAGSSNVYCKLAMRSLTSTELNGNNIQAHFNTMTVDGTTIALADVPTILYELGLFPIADSCVDGLFQVGFGNDERIAKAGDNFYVGRNSVAQGLIPGIASLSFVKTNVRSLANNANRGCRPRARVLA